jgi:hypothetical protein
MELLVTFQFHFRVLRVEVSPELLLVSNQVRERDGDLRGMIVLIVSQ